MILCGVPPPQLVVFLYSSLPLGWKHYVFCGVPPPQPVVSCFSLPLRLGQGALVRPPNNPTPTGLHPVTPLGYGPRSGRFVPLTRRLVHCTNIFARDAHRAKRGRRGTYRLLAGVNGFATKGKRHRVGERHLNYRTAYEWAGAAKRAWAGGVMGKFI